MTLPFESYALIAWVLGLAHGFDPDHLAAIDGLTRFNSARDARWARFCGLLFSTGHGIVVMVVAMLVGAHVGEWSPPSWLDAAGVWISLTFLYWIGTANLVAVLRTRTREPVPVAGPRSWLFGPLLRVGHRPGIVLVGAAFAISFDTISQAALFGAAASRYGGFYYSALLGALFMFGMMASDAANGLWIARLIRGAGRRAGLASRVVGGTIAVTCLAVALFNTARFALPAVEHWSEGMELVVSGLLFGVILLSYAGVASIARGKSRPARNV